MFGIRTRDTLCFFGIHCLVVSTLAQNLFMISRILGRHLPPLQSFMKNGPTPTSYLFIFIVFKHKFYRKNCRLWTGIVGVEGTHADHLISTTAKIPYQSYLPKRFARSSQRQVIWQSSKLTGFRLKITVAFSRFFYFYLAIKFWINCCWRLRLGKTLVKCETDRGTEIMFIELALNMNG